MSIIGGSYRNMDEGLFIGAKNNSKAATSTRLAPAWMMYIKAAKPGAHFTVRR